MRDLLISKNSIITGARRGIGRATVEVFASQGSNVWACARKPDEEFEAEMTLLAEKYGVSIKPVYFEMTDPQEIKAAVNIIRKDNLPIDILVNNAGTTYDALLPMLSIEKAKSLFDTNFFSHVIMTQLVARIMMKQKTGCIINVSSYLAEEGNRGQSVYSASKAAINAFTKSIAKEFSEYGIRVNAIAPGVVDTDLIQSMSDKEMDAIMEHSMIHRPADPMEIANVMAMISSDQSSYINGQIIRVDGGLY